ncbi:MAG: hypothetical protein M1569_01185 [Candidatus Marsarchaeota archaeon]|nr:hypothetical protein [Candidatus Marsarchaeota archaeon]MCL5413002.1 hypothetical protein [Candidatus Marsarchaeota archaeon]
MKTPALLLLVAVLAAPMLHASSTSLNIINCKNLFNGISSLGATHATTIYLVNQNLVSIAGNPAGFLGVSLLIVLAVLTILGLVFAAGIAFHIETLMQYARSELFEVFISLLLITLVVGGTPAFDGAISTLANFGSATAGAAPTAAITNARNVNIEACDNIQNNIMNAGLTNFAGLFAALIFNNIIVSFTVQVQPNGLGFTFAPFAGDSLITQLLYDEQMIFFGSIMFGTFLIMLLFLIYFLFPIFFYVGIVLRSFPWTRAAGGSLIALFVSFWIVFPALMYSFSAVTAPVSTSTCPTGYGLPTSTSTSGCLQFPKYTSFFSVSQFESLFPNLANMGGQYESNLDSFAQSIGYTAVQIVGLLISLFISYEMVEKLGGLLGAPSMQSQRMLSKVL